MQDIDAYLARIGLAGVAVPSWQAIHRAHATSIPFENLDPLRGIPVSLEQGDLERKLVGERRGGYCFEHNMLFASALQQLGLQVEPILARRRTGGAARKTQPATHLMLRVTGADGVAWHADVGFGFGTLLDPIPFGADPEAVHEQSGWSFRVVEEGSELVLQTLAASGWSDVYAFAPRAVPRIDIEVSNWWTCTNPGSPFVRGILASVSHDDGRRELICDWSGPLEATEMTPVAIEVSEQPRSIIPARLEQFGLPGFALDGEGRVR